MTAYDVVSEWAGETGPRHSLFVQRPELILRWLNQAQLRFVDRSECLRSTWSPTLDDSGKVPLPDDFLRIADGKTAVCWSADEFLVQDDYSKLSGLTLSSTEHYAIHDGRFYVFAAASGTPTVIYIKKPEELLMTNYKTASLDVKEEFHQDLLVYMDASFARHDGNVREYLALQLIADGKAMEAGAKVHDRTEPVPHTVARSL